mgnify:CR=1 FL=1
MPQPTPSNEYLESWIRAVVGQSFKAEEFDRWLRAVKAEAWAEGFDEASDDTGRDEMMHDMGESLNRFRD